MSLREGGVSESPIFAHDVGGGSKWTTRDWLLCFGAIGAVFVIVGGFAVFNQIMGARFGSDDCVCPD